MPDISDFTRSGYRTSAVVNQHENAVFTYGNIFVTPKKKEIQLRTPSQYAFSNMKTKSKCLIKSREPDELLWITNPATSAAKKGEY